MQSAKAHFIEALHTRYCPPFIPGMADVVRALAVHSTLAVVSANTMGAIRRILLNEHLATCFAHVFSGDLEAHKSVSIQRFVGSRGYTAKRLCTPDYHTSATPLAALDTEDLVLVTDTVGDVAEATKVGVRAIGVSWGMHSEQQLLQAGAQRVALWPQELLVWLRSDAPISNDSAVISTTCRCQCSPVHAESDIQTLEPQRSGMLRRAGHLQRRQQAAALANPPHALQNTGQEQLHHALARIMDAQPATTNPSAALAS